MDKQKIEMPYGWLSPNGDFYKCKYYEHNATAEKICEKMSIKYVDTWGGKDDALYALGWCKLGLSSWGDRKYWVYWKRPLTAYQRYFLKEYFENEKELKFPMDTMCLCKYFHEDKFFRED